MWSLITEQVIIPDRPPNGNQSGAARASGARACLGSRVAAVGQGNEVSARCLGGFSLCVRGEYVDPARWGTRNGGPQRVVAVMAYLIAHRERCVTREELVDIFWSESDGDRANQCLDRTISALRQALEPGLQKYRPSGFILGPRGGYRLSPELDITVDAEEFVSRFKEAVEVERRSGLAAAAALFREAEACYGGPFMCGVPYAELWCHYQRQLLADYHRTALTRLAHFAWLEDELEGATSYAHRVLGEYGCQGDVCRWLVETYVEKSAPAAARRHVTTCPYRGVLAGAPCPDLSVPLRR